MISWILKLLIGNVSDELLKIEVKSLKKETLSNHRVMESCINTLQRQIDKLKGTQ